MSRSRSRNNASNATNLNFIKLSLCGCQSAKHALCHSKCMAKVVERIWSVVLPYSDGEAHQGIKIKPKSCLFLKKKEKFSWTFST